MGPVVFRLMAARNSLKKGHLDDIEQSRLGAVRIPPFVGSKRFRFARPHRANPLPQLSIRVNRQPGYTMTVALPRIGQADDSRLKPHN
jgi:hypothetical protein